MFPIRSPILASWLFWASRVSVHSQSCPNTVTCLSNACGETGSITEQCQPCQTGTCGCRPASGTKPSVSPSLDSTVSQYACSSTFITSSPGIVPNTICNSWVVQAARYYNYALSGSFAFVIDTCICSPPTSTCPYIRSCNSASDRFAGSYYNVFPSRTYCGVRSGSSTPLRVAFNQQGVASASQRWINCTFNQLPVYLNNSLTVTKFAYGYCNGTQLPIGGCQNGQVYMRFEYKEFNNTLLQSGTLNAIGALQLDSCECNANAYWLPSNRLVGCTLCSQTCDSQTEYCDNTNQCMCRRGYIRDPVFNNLCVSRCDVVSDTSAGIVPSYNTPYCDNKVCPNCNTTASSITQCDGLMGTCICKNIQSGGVCPSTFSVNSSAVLCRQPDVLITPGINVCECVMDASGQCILRGSARCRSFGSTFIQASNQSETCRINATQQYTTSVQVGYPDSSLPGYTLSCTAASFAPAAEGSYVALCRHATRMCSGRGVRFSTIYTASTINSTYILAKMVTFNDSCQCDPGYSGLQCEQTCLVSNGGSCDGNTTYCTRNNTCLCLDNLVPSTNISCECPYPATQYGRSCTNCSCSMGVPRSACNGGFYGNGSCYCPGLYVFNINQTSCVCPSRRFGSDCSGICPTTCPLHSTCYEGLQGNGSCLCDSGFQWNTSTQSCECLSGRYGSNCTGLCPQSPSCEVSLPHSTCYDGRSGNGTCLCLTPNFILNTTNNTDPFRSCICAKGLYGFMCNQTCINCSTSVDINSVCDEGIQGTGQCRCPSTRFITQSNSTSLCACKPGFFGPTCQLCLNCTTSYSPYSECNDTLSGNGQCRCQSNFTYSSTLHRCICPPGVFGPLCQNICPVCSTVFDPHSYCDEGQLATGRCLCLSPVFNRSTSSVNCTCTDPNAFGFSCNFTCPLCDPHALCDAGVKGSGQCVCQSPFVAASNHSLTNPTCDCPPNVYGSQCFSNCTFGKINTSNSRCDTGIQGTGTISCLNQFNLTDNCNSCLSGFYGPSCNQTCPFSPAPCSLLMENTHCLDGLKGNGSCVCNDGFVWSLNKTQCVCPSGQYGSQCKGSCSSVTCPAHQRCDDGQQGSGLCVCAPTLVHSSTDAYCACAANYYGSQCQLHCPDCGAYAHCLDGIDGTGTCVCNDPLHFQPRLSTMFQGCECRPGWAGINCTVACPICPLLNSACNEGLSGTGTCVCNSPYFTYSYSSQQCECTLTNAYGPFCNQIVTSNCPDPNARPSLGRLGDGKCYCLPPYFSFNNQSQTCQCSNSQAYGLACDQMCPSNCIDSKAQCDGGRINSTGICTCIQPFQTVSTVTPQQQLCDCPSGRAGSTCQLQCPNCTAIDAHSYCPDGRNIQSVNCICKPGYIYNSFTQRCDCPDNQYGSECQFICPVCPDIHSRCKDGLEGTGKCLCFPSFVPMNDTCICPPQMYGSECNQTCPMCANTFDIDSICQDGLQGDGSCQCPFNHFITTSTGCICQPGRYGIHCDHVCPDCVSNWDIHSQCVEGRWSGTGECKCISPWFVDNGNKTCQCAPGLWGENCLNACPSCMDSNAICDEGLSGSGKCICNGSSHIFTSIHVHENQVQCLCAEGQYGPRCQWTNPMCDDSHARAYEGRCYCLGLSPNPSNQSYHFQEIQAPPSSNQCDCLINFFGDDCSQSCRLDQFPLHSSCLDGRQGNGSFTCNGPEFIYDNSLHQCVCRPHYYGPQCNQLCSTCVDTHALCQDGEYGNGQCACPSLFIQTSDQHCICPPGQYNWNCTGHCDSQECPDHAYCQDGLMGDGQCYCNEGFDEKREDTTLLECVCPPSRFGPMCQGRCMNCNLFDPANTTLCFEGKEGNGTCLCRQPQYIPTLKSIDQNMQQCICPPLFYGTECTLRCPECDPHANCNEGKQGNGQCICQDPFIPILSTPDVICDCPHGRFGSICNETCPVCGHNEFCIDGYQGTGACACTPGTVSKDAHSSGCDCEPGRYGPQCEQVCHFPCLDPNSHCFDMVAGNGSCLCNEPEFIRVGSTPSGIDAICDCRPGFWSSSCTEVCPLQCPIHSRCSEGLNGTGECVCDHPFIMQSIVNDFLNTSTLQCVCPSRTYGSQCEQICPVCADPLSLCVEGEFGTGECLCISPYVHSNLSGLCDCPVRTFGLGCTQLSTVCSDIERSHMTSGINATGRCECNSPVYVDWNVVEEEDGVQMAESQGCICRIDDLGETLCLCANPLFLSSLPILLNSTSTSINFLLKQPRCDCPSQHSGSNCSRTCPACSILDPNSHCREGVLGDGMCVCNATFQLNSTGQCVCPTQRYGSQCQSSCNLTTPCSSLDPNSHCLDGQFGNGQCICDDGLIRMNGTCQCPVNSYGNRCQFTCPIQCPLYSHCDSGRYGTGQCVANSAFFTTYLSPKNNNDTIQNNIYYDCTSTRFGSDCSQLCPVCFDSHSHCQWGVNGTGVCLCASLFTWSNSLLRVCDCIPGRTGLDCTLPIPICGPNAQADYGVMGNGSCYCLPGFEAVYQTIHSTLPNPSTLLIDCLPPPPPSCSSSQAQYNNFTHRCDCVNNPLAYGPNCNFTCSFCTGSHTQCDTGYTEATGQCTCTPPFVAIASESQFYCTCPVNTYGSQCEFACPAGLEKCEIHEAVCSQGEFGNGHCICQHPYEMNSRGMCDCPAGRSGELCNQVCPVCSDSRQICKTGRSIQDPLCNCTYPFVWSEVDQHCDCPIGIYGPLCESKVIQINCPVNSFLDDGVTGSGKCICDPNLSLQSIYATADQTRLQKCSCFNSTGKYGSPDCPFDCPLCVSPAYCDSDRMGTGACLCPVGWMLNVSNPFNTTCIQQLCPAHHYGLNCSQICTCPPQFLCDDQKGILSTGQCYPNPCANNANYNIYSGTCTCISHYIDTFCDAPACAHGTLQLSNRTCLCDIGFSGTFCDYIETTQQTIVWLSEYEQRAMDILYPPVNTTALNSTASSNLLLNRTLAAVLSDTITSAVSTLSTTQTALAITSVSVAGAAAVISRLQSISTS